MGPAGKPKIILVGYYGAQNIGDEAILSASIANLKQYFEIVVLGIGPDNPMNNQEIGYAKLPSLRRPVELLRFAKLISNADALVLGGGGFIANKLQPLSAYYWICLILVAKLLGKKVVLFAGGCGPFEKGIRSLPIKFTLNGLSGIILRDSASEKFVQELGVTALTRVTADVAFLLQPSYAHDSPINQIPSPKVLFVLPIRYHIKSIWKKKEHREKYSSYVASIAEVADFVVEELKGTPIFFPFAPQDLGLYSEVIASMRNKKDAVLFNDINHKKIDFDRIFRIFQDVDLVVGGRYHSVIFSLITGTPVIPLIYHPKIHDLASRTDLQDISLEIGDGIEWRDVDLNIPLALHNLARVYQNKASYKVSTCKYKDEMKLKAANGIDILRSLI
jgi:polysaccharide pyruvyl transferase CsaB